MAYSLPMTRGERAADALSRFVGSWKFIWMQAMFLTVWFILNVCFIAWAWDPYPFILANLFMSAEAAFTAPVIMMAQNRTDAADRSVLHADLKLDQDSFEILKRIERKLQDEADLSIGSGLACQCSQRPADDSRGEGSL